MQLMSLLKKKKTNWSKERSENNETYSLNYNKLKMNYNLMNNKLLNFINNLFDRFYN